MPVTFGQDLPADDAVGLAPGYRPGAADDREAVVVPGRRARLAVQPPGRRWRRRFPPTTTAGGW
jgi:hypothetical protein